MKLIDCHWSHMAEKIQTKVVNFGQQLNGNDPKQVHND
jgi:hypothetical protein